MGISHQKAAHIGPVFIQIGIGRARHDGAGHIAAPAGERTDAPVRAAAVKARNHCPVRMRKHCGQGVIGPFAVKGPVLGKEDVVLGVQKMIAQIIRQKQAVEVFSPACTIVLAGPGEEIAFNFVQLRYDVHLQPQFGCDGHKTLPNLRKGGRKILSLLMEAIGAIEQVRHLFVAVKALSGGAGHHVAAPCIHFNDLPDLYKLARIRKRAAAEFGHDLSHGRCSLPAVRRLKVLTKIYSIRKRVSKSIPGPVSGCMTKNHPRALWSGMVHDMRISGARCHALASYSSLSMLRMPTSQKRPSVKNAWRFTPSITKPAF